MLLTNDGQTLQLHFAQQSSQASFGAFDDEYEAAWIEFHAPSEHTIDGEHYAFEIQIMHRKNKASLAAISVLYEVGDNSDFLDNLGWRDAGNQAVPGPGQSKKLETDVDFARAFGPALLNGGYYYYLGSLTAPPCSEIVKWYVVDKPATLSPSQLAAFREVFPNPPGNNRPVQRPFNTVMGFTNDVEVSYGVG